MGQLPKFLEGHKGGLKQTTGMVVERKKSLDPGAH